MKKSELCYREILFQAMEKKNRKLTQAYLARTIKISLSTVNNALEPLRRMNAIKVERRSFRIIDAKKILYYWASIRNLEKDIIYKTRVDKPVREIEREMPDNIVYAGFSAFKFKFKDVPADYSEVYVYGENLEKRFARNEKNPNLFVLRKDDLIEKYNKTGSIAQIFVDLWNLRQWYAKDFLKALEKRCFSEP